jgi:hypothetical protein
MIYLTTNMNQIEVMINFSANIIQNLLRIGSQNLKKCKLLALIILMRVKKEKKTFTIQL